MSIIRIKDREVADIIRNASGVPGSYYVSQNLGTYIANYYGQLEKIFDASSIPYEIVGKTITTVKEKIDSINANTFTLQITQIENELKYLGNKASKELIFTGEDLTGMKVYSDVTKSNLLYEVIYAYDDNGNISNKIVIRKSDNFSYSKNFIYDTAGELIQMDVN